MDPAELVDPGQQAEPRPLHQARRQDYPHWFRTAFCLQCRPDRPGDRRRQPSIAAQRSAQGRCDHRRRGEGVHAGTALPGSGGPGQDRKIRRNVLEYDVSILGVDILFHVAIAIYAGAKGRGF